MRSGLFQIPPVSPVPLSAFPLPAWPASPSTSLYAVAHCNAWINWTSLGRAGIRQLRINWYFSSIYDKQNYQLSLYWNNRMVLLYNVPSHGPWSGFFSQQITFIFNLDVSFLLVWTLSTQKLFLNAIICYRGRAQRCGAVWFWCGFGSGPAEPSVMIPAPT